MAPVSDFYLRYYVGHKGKFGHEFLEFEFRPDGQVQCLFNGFGIDRCLSCISRGTQTGVTAN